MNSRIYSQPLIIYIHLSDKEDASFFFFFSVPCSVPICAIPLLLQFHPILPHGNFNSHHVRILSIEQCTQEIVCGCIVRKYKYMHAVDAEVAIAVFRTLTRAILCSSFISIRYLSLIPHKSDRVELGYPICGEVWLVGIVKCTLMTYPSSQFRIGWI